MVASDPIWHAFDNFQRKCLEVALPKKEFAVCPRSYYTGPFCSTRAGNEYEYSYQSRTSEPGAGAQYGDFGITLRGPSDHNRIQVPECFKCLELATFHSKVIVKHERFKSLDKRGNGVEITLAESVREAQRLMQTSSYLQHDPAINSPMTVSMVSLTVVSAEDDLISCHSALSFRSIWLAIKGIYYDQSHRRP